MFHFLFFLHGGCLYRNWRCWMKTQLYTSLLVPHWSSKISPRPKRTSISELNSLKEKCMRAFDSSPDRRSRFLLSLDCVCVKIFYCWYFLCHFLQHHFCFRLVLCFLILFLFVLLALPWLCFVAFSYVVPFSLSSFLFLLSFSIVLYLLVLLFRFVVCSLLVSVLGLTRNSKISKTNETMPKKRFHHCCLSVYERNRGLSARLFCSFFSSLFPSRSLSSKVSRTKSVHCCVCCPILLVTGARRREGRVGLFLLPFLPFLPSPFSLFRLSSSSCSSFFLSRRR